MKTLKPGFSIGIPVLEDLESASKKVLSLRKCGFEGPIIVSVNSASSDCETRSTYAFRDMNCRVYLHGHNKGLYGNFKFILDSVETSHFMWVALDDFPPEQLLSGDWKPSSDSDLSIGSLAVTESLSSGYGKVLESVPASTFFTCDPLQIHPGYVFGVWKTEFARSVWPRKSMDWLDTFILLCARTLGKVEAISDSGMWIIGHSQKSPHKVNGRFHNPLSWGCEVLRLYGWKQPMKVYLHLARTFAGKARFGITELKEYLRKLPSGK